MLFFYSIVMNATFWNINLIMYVAGLFTVLITPQNFYTV